MLHSPFLQKGLEHYGQGKLNKASKGKVTASKGKVTALNGKVTLERQGHRPQGGSPFQRQDVKLYVRGR